MQKIILSRPKFWMKLDVRIKKENTLKFIEYNFQNNIIVLTRQTKTSDRQLKNSKQVDKVL